MADDESESIQVWCARVEGKLDGISLQLHAQTVVSGDHESRIRMVEQKIWMITGGLMLVAAAGGSSFIYLFSR